MLSIYARRIYNLLREEGLYEFISYLSDLSFYERLFYQYPRFRITTFKNRIYNNFRYEVPPNPYKVIQITPSEIEYWIGLKKNENGEWLISPPTYGGLGQIRGGKWDNMKYRDRTDSLPAIAGFEERFIQGKDWEDTKYYAHLQEKYNTTQKYKKFGFDNLDQYLKSNLSEYEDLYESIKNNGYKKGHKGTRKELGNRDLPNVHDILEVLVCIDRNGQIHLIDGHNRFGIARALNIKIPAHVVCRHEQWQKKRDDIYDNGLSQIEESSLSNHPDLNDILDANR